MTTVVDSGTTRKSGVVSLGKGAAPTNPGDAYGIDGTDVAATSGILNVWGIDSAGTVYGGVFHWIKSKTTTGKIGDEQGVFPIGDSTDISYVDANLVTSYKKAIAGAANSKLNVYFDTDKIYLQNGWDSTGGNPASIGVCWEVTIIKH